MLTSWFLTDKNLGRGENREKGVQADNMKFQKDSRKTKQTVVSGT